MILLIKRFFKIFPTLLLAFVLGIAVWISAVTSSDPAEERVYPRPLLLEITGQDTLLILINDVQSQVSLSLNAPRSIWDRLVSENIPVKASIDLSNLGPGEHNIPVQIKIGIRPVQITSYSPQSVEVVLENLVNRFVPVQLIQRGEVAVGYQAAIAILSQTTVRVSGPESRVKQVQDVKAILDLNLAHENINRSLNLEAVDADGNPVGGVKIEPSEVSVSLAINQRGGFRNVSVKIVYRGQVADGYRMTYLSVYPPMVMVFSDDPAVVLSLPGYVETAPMDLTGLKTNITEKLNLNLPDIIRVVGDSKVEVQVGIDAIESSRTFFDMKVELNGLSPDLEASISPEKVDVILSGPLPILNEMTPSDVRILVNLKGEGIGNYQRELQVEMNFPELHVDTINPNTVDIKLTQAPIQTATPSSTPEVTQTVAATP